MNFDPHFKSLQDGRTDINIQYELLDIVFLTPGGYFMWSRRLERHSTLW